MGEIDDGTASGGTFTSASGSASMSSASMSDATTVPTGATDSAETSDEDPDDPCGGQTPCEDASADIPITGGVSAAIVPSNQVDLTPWTMAGLGGMSLTGSEASESLTGAELGDTLNGLGGSTNAHY